MGCHSLLQRIFPTQGLNQSILHWRQILCHPSHQFSLVQFSSVAQSCPTLCDPMDCSTPGLPVHHPSWNLLKLMSIELVMVSNHLILCHPFSSCLQSFPASGSFQMSHFFTSGGQSFGVSPPASVLISFRMDRFDPLAVQGTLKSFLQHHSSKASVLWYSAFFIVQLSHPYWKTHSFD